MKTIVIFALIAVPMLMVSCKSSRTAVKVEETPQPQVQTINLALIDNPQADKFANLEYGIRLNVQDGRSDKRLIQVYDAVATSKPTANVNPEITSFIPKSMRGIMRNPVATSKPTANVNLEITSNPEITSFIPESMRRYMRTMGFNMDADVSTDYLMQVTIKEFHTDWLSGIGWYGTVIMQVKIFDHNRTLVYPTTEVAGRASVYGSATSMELAQQAINKAYGNALADIDWDRVAYFLHRSKDPKQEGNKQVTGDGNTALEHLPVHWNVNSRPQGADVEWRIISKTPDVKNQNYKYLETTPYEGSETLDIKGLTYNNSGLVQIEIKVSKTGYYTQTKKHDIRSIIDDPDVSYMFRLVPEE